MAHATSRQDYTEPSYSFGFEASEGEDSLGSQQIKQEKNRKLVNLLTLSDKFKSTSKIY